MLIVASGLPNLAAIGQPLAVSANDGQINMLADPDDKRDLFGMLQPAA